MRRLSIALALALLAAASLSPRRSNTMSSSKAAASWTPRPASTPSATSAFAKEKSRASPPLRSAAARHSRRRAGRRSRLHRPASARPGPRQPARQSFRRRDHRAGNGNRRARRRAISEVEGRPLAHPLRHHRQPRGGARALIFGAPLPGGRPRAASEILPKSGPATDQPATPEQIAANSAAPARRTRRRRARHRHGNSVHAGRDAA